MYIILHTRNLHIFNIDIVIKNPRVIVSIYNNGYVFLNLISLVCQYFYSFYCFYWKFTGFIFDLSSTFHFHESFLLYSIYRKEHYQVFFFCYRVTTNTNKVLYAFGNKKQK